MPLSQYILDAREEFRLQTRERNTWLTRLRWYYLVILAAVIVVASYLTQAQASRNRQFALTTAGIGLTLNFILWALTKPKNRSIYYYHSVAVAQLILDITLAASIVYFQGGLSSRATVLFAIPIVGAGLLFTKGFAYVSAFLSAVGYVLALVIYRHNNPGSYELWQVTLPAVFYAVVFLIIAIIVSAYRNKTASNEREKSYTELLSMLRHQLYHPTSVIAAIIDMLQHGEHYSKWPAGDKNYLQQLKRENKKLHTMIANALEAIRTDQDEIKQTKVFDIVPLLNDEAVSCATGAKRVSDLKTMLPNKTIEVEGDAQQLTTALDNVIENAFRYTEKGTPVIVSISEENYKVTISVHDKGEGMSDADQKALFQLFSKMQSRISGDPEKLYDTGLGLYVSKLIIERHKGKLELSSSKEYGTNVTITLYRRLI
jgi:two-component system phosphate regulon sensor histidine kinase PhoR